MNQHVIATAFLLGMGLLCFWTAWRVWKDREKEEQRLKSLGWQAEATASTLLGLQWLFFAFYLYRRPQLAYLIGDVVIPMLFVLPAIALIGYGLIWRLTQRRQ